MDSRFFLSCDWGTTHFRLRLVNAGDGTVLDELKTADGVARMSGGFRGASREEREEYYSSFLTSKAAILFERNGVDALCCVISGMASSRLGWKELPYAMLPQPLDASGLVTESLRVPVKGHPVLDVILVSGVRNNENVMRGEETEIIGLAQALPFISNATAVTLIMPGTHSKHVKLSMGKITGFETLMTGEFYAHLSTMPTLRDSLGPDTTFDATHPSFIRGLHEAASPGFFKSLFKIRARNLLMDASTTDGSASLSGLLIGTELLQVSAEPESRILIAAGGSLRALYRKATTELGLANMELVDGNEVEKSTVNGHLAIIDG